MRCPSSSASQDKGFLRIIRTKTTKYNASILKSSFRDSPETLELPAVWLPGHQRVTPPAPTVSSFSLKKEKFLIDYFPAECKLDSTLHKVKLTMLIGLSTLLPRFPSLPKLRTRSFHDLVDDRDKQFLRPVSGRARSPHGLLSVRGFSNKDREFTSSFCNDRHESKEVFSSNRDLRHRFPTAPPMAHVLIIVLRSIKGILFIHQE